MVGDVMNIPLTIKTDYSLLKSMIKVKDLIHLKTPAIGIVDDNLGYVMEFFTFCENNNIKPIVGLDLIYNNFHIYLYAKNLDGYKNLVILNNLKENITLEILKQYKDELILLLPNTSISMYQELNAIFDVYIAYQNNEEKTKALELTSNVVFTNLTLALNPNDVNYLKYLKSIETGIKLDEIIDDYSLNYFMITNDAFDILTTEKFASLFNLKLDFSKRYIPKIENGEAKLESLIKKGINKRLNNQVTSVYAERIKYEFSVIKEMGFIDYFLIVYDYVLYAKKNNILVGPGRGSGAGCLIAYALGITDIDPLKYNLIFERFLNKERITMPDIDLDFEDVKREQVINYIKGKYGSDYVALIMTFGTLGARQAIRDVAKALDINISLVDEISSLINPRISLKDNLIDLNLKNRVTKNELLTTMYQVALKLEGLKRHISTHAAGIVISSENLSHLIPLVKSGEEYLTGFTMEYLERLGLIKMDILSLYNLSAISGVKSLVKESINEDINLNTLPLDDAKTLKLFHDVDTIGIFQFESKGMMKFLAKLKVNSFTDLINAVALFRPGPMENIDSFIARREGKEKVDYIDPSLEPILKDTYGIIVFQEQVLEILNKMGSYSYAEADNVRRAMSKKKKDVILKEKSHFIENSIKNGYKREVAEKVYNYIMKFANYGFNKAHSVAYALVGYWMGYLKSNYRVSFISSLLNINMGSEVKTKEHIMEAKKKDISILKPDINTSELKFKIVNYNILMPLTSIKNVGVASCEAIMIEREKGLFKDYLDFVARCYGKSVNKKIIESLIYGGAFDSFGLSRRTLIENITSAITYAELMHDLDESLVEKPLLEMKEEYSMSELTSQETASFGMFLSNHPSSKYKDVIKTNQMSNYFDKFITMVLLVDRISNIKTKKGDDMTFIDGTDEYGTVSCVFFPDKVYLLENVKRNDLIKVVGRVTKRFDRYDFAVSKVEIIG